MSNLPTNPINQDDWGNLPQKITPVYVKVGQPTSEGFERGKFNFAGKIWPATERLENLVLLRPQMGRVLFGKTFKSPSRCGSDNHVVPSPRYEPVINPTCKDCYAAKWDNELDDTGVELKRKLEADLDKKPARHPLCAETINLIVADKDQRPMIIQAKSTQLKVVWASLINKIKYSGKRPWEVTWDLSLTDKGKYFEFNFHNFRDNQNPEPFRAMAEFLKEYGEQMVAEEHEKMDAEKDETEVPF